MESKPCILIVDDNTSLCRTMSLILERKGYAVTTAQDGLTAIERVREHSFDVTFLDIKMLPTNGVETYKQIKGIRPEAIVMMMTAYAVEDLVQEALEEGACGVVYKPLDVDQVLAVIGEAGKQETGSRGQEAR